MFLRQFTLILYNLFLAICFCMKDNISTKFVSKSRLLHKVAYGAAIICGKMSIKEVNDGLAGMLKIPSDDQGLRISMENLKLKDNQKEECESANHPICR